MKTVDDENVDAKQPEKHPKLAQDKSYCMRKVFSSYYMYMDIYIRVKTDRLTLAHHMILYSICPHLPSIFFCQEGCNLNLVFEPRKGIYNLR